MSAYPNIPDPMLGLSLPERIFVGRCIALGGYVDDVHVEAFRDGHRLARKLWDRGIVDGVNGGYRITEKGRAVWEGRK